MHFAYPGWVWLSALAALAGAAAVGALARRRLALRRLTPSAAPLLLARPWVQAVKTALVVAAALLLAVAVLGPQWGREAVEAPPAAGGRDVLVVLDVSRSMLAEDVAPNRLERARADVRDLADALERAGGHRAGLVVFADRAAVLCPLTDDFRCFHEELSRAGLDALRLRGSGGRADGTQIGAALRRAADAIDSQNAAATDVLLISDGGDMDDDTLDAAAELARLGVVVHTVGVGDPAEGAPIPVVGPGGQRTFLKYKDEVVRVPLTEDVLRRVAEKTGGRYVAARTGFLELDRFYSTVLAPKEGRERAAAGPNWVGVHRFQWFLAPAAALLILELFLSDGRRSVAASVQQKYFRWVRRKQAA